MHCHDHTHRVTPLCDILHIIQIQTLSRASLIMLAFASPAHNSCVSLSVSSSLSFQKLIFFFKWAICLFPHNLIRVNILAGIPVQGKLRTLRTLSRLVRKASWHWSGTALHESWHVISGEERMGQWYLPSLLELEKSKAERKGNTSDYSESDLRPHHCPSAWCTIRILNVNINLCRAGDMLATAIKMYLRTNLSPSFSYFLLPLFPPSFLAFLLAGLGTEYAFHMPGSGRMDLLPLN